MSNFPKRLRELRLERKWYQKDVAKKLKITESAYGYYEQGRREPSNDTLQKLANIFGVSTDYLLGRSDKRETDWDSKLPELTEKEERDIALQLEKMLNDLDDTNSISFYGEPMDEETKAAMKISLENSLRLAKQLAKQKFTPKKYRK